MDGAANARLPFSTEGVAFGNGLADTDVGNYWQRMMAISGRVFVRSVDHFVPKK